MLTTQSTESIRSLDARWQEYHDKVLVPSGAGEIQIIETRRAFYFGANAVFLMITTAPDRTEAKAAYESALADLFKFFRALEESRET